MSDSQFQLQFLQGRAAERRRLGSILLAPEADGRERTAIELALKTGLSAEDARRALGALSRQPCDASAAKAPRPHSSKQGAAHDR